MSCDFDIGFLQGSTTVNLRTSQDLLDVWNDIAGGKNIVLWCDGLKDDNCKSKRKRKIDDSCTVDSGDDDDVNLSTHKSIKKKKEEKKDRHVENTITELKEMHGSNFTNMQYRIWSEMIIGGICSSLTEPPNVSKGWW